MAQFDQNERPESFGQWLRRERELREIPLEEIAAYTRIKLRALEAIERDDYSALPPLAFIRAFIRCYADYIGLRVPDAMLRFDGFIQNRYPELTGEIPVLYRSPRPKQRYLPLLFGVAAALVIMLSFWLHRSPEQSPGTAQLKPPETETAEASGIFFDRERKGAWSFFAVPDEPEMQADPPPVEEPAPVPEISRLPPPGAPWKSTHEEQFGPPRRLAMLPTREPTTGETGQRRVRHRATITVKEPCWIKYIIDDDDPRQTILKPDQTVTFEAAFSVKVKIGNPDGVTSVIYNEQPFPFNPRCAPWWLNFPASPDDNTCP